VRVEIVADTLAADALPWELLRDTATGADIALAARSIGRTTTAAAAAFSAVRDDDEVRILIVIARPEGRLDVGFRSIAGPLLRELTASGASVSVDVLRPPTFEQLQIVLRAARDDGHPYDLVHFDGHGELDPADGRSALVFEAGDEAGTLVRGDVVGEELRACDVPLLVLNACRSAAGGHEQTYGSVAREALEQGLAAVVAMRFNVYVPTAALFVGGLYRALGEGRQLSDAMTEARRRLAERADRDGLPVVRDWCVPALYQAAPLRLATAGARGARPTARELRLPAPPAHGFVGRDEVFVELEGVLVGGPHVMVRAFSGAGKTTAACEFARWYMRTGGCQVAGPLVNVTDAPAADELARRIGAIEDRSLVIWDDVRVLDRDHDLLLDDIAARGGRVLAITDRLAGTDRLPLVPLPNLPGEEGLALALAVATDAGSALSPDDAVELWRGTRGHALATELAVRELPRRGVGVATLMEELESPTNGDPAAWARPVGADLDIDAAPPEVTLVAQFRGTGTVIGLSCLRDGGDDMDAADTVLEDLRRRGLVTRISPVAFVIHPGLPVALAAKGRYEPPGSGFARAVSQAVNLWIGFAEMQGGEVPWQAEAPNILAARRIASRERDWPVVVQLLDGVDALGTYAGRQDVRHDEIVAAAPDFVDPDTGVPRPGMDAFHTAVLGHLASAAELEGDKAKVVRLRTQDVRARRATASAALAVAPERRDGGQRDLVRRLAVGLTNLGPAQSDLGDAAALATMDEAVALARELGDWRLDALNRLNRGVHHMTVPRPPDFDRAGAEFAAGYSLAIQDDQPLAGKLMTERGTVHYERALASGDPAERAAHLQQAADLLEFAVGLRVPDAVLFHQLGQVHRHLGNLADARAWFEQAIELREQERVPGAGADARLHLAEALEEAGLIDEAISFARSAEELFAQAPDATLELELDQTLARLALRARS
jgi:hypothetical protein